MSGPPDTHSPLAAWRFLLPAGLVEGACLAALAWWPPAAGEAGRLLIFGAAFAAYAVAASLVKDARGGALWIWGVAVALRLVLLPADPVLSHEVYRYLWDGEVQLGGVNPFRFAPVAHEVAGIRSEWFSLVPGTSMLSPYPPVPQVAFLALALVGSTVLQAKLLWLGFDLGTGWLLGRVALFSGRSRRLTQLLYLWSPLLVVEGAWNGHLVPLALFLLTLVVLLARAPVSAGVAAGLAAMAAPVTLAALPALVVRMKGRFLLGCLAGLAVPLIPYLTAPRSMAAGVAGPLFGGPSVGGPFLLLESALPPGIDRWAVVGVVTGVAVWAAAHRFRPERALLWVLGAALLSAPALHPASALWVLPFAALRVSRPWLLFSGLAFLAHVGAGGTPGASSPAPLWAQLALWIPFLALLGLEARRHLRDRFPLPPVET
ncbi:MAG: hypothetical protein AMXMBFR53_12140 [Gemmatimonadota bacterium]